jgi:Domain of unknown function (DUF4838)
MIQLSHRSMFPGMLFCFLTAPVALAEPEARLAADSKALLPVVIGKATSDRVRQAAHTLGDYLGRISGSKFEVLEGDGTSGLAVGRPADFPSLPVQKLWDSKDPRRTEDYLLRSHDRGVYLIGASELAVEHAVWDLLYRLGHRQFFPGPAWEVVPLVPDLRLTVDAIEQPSYHARRIWYGYGAWDVNAKAYAGWCSRNRATSGIVLNTGHAYDGILSRNRAAFQAHPEYLGLVNGQRKSSKFCISNPSLRKLVVEDALARFRADPSAQSVSVDPSDGGGWCECEKCRALGSVSDRALLLANEVAAAVEKKYPGKYVGMYAYNEHSPPPSIRAHPRVVISVATGFIKGGYTVEQLMDGWARQGATLGVREYYGVNVWDRDLPGRARGSNIGYLKDTIPAFHKRGARFLSAESSDNWGPNGLGYYLAARMLWDVGEARKVEALVDDFLTKAFGSAREPMRAFYRLLDGGRKPLLSDDLIGRMYRLLADARKHTDDAQVHARLDDLILYTRYVEFWSDYAPAQGTARQTAFESLIRHAYRMRRTMMIHSLALYRDLPRRDRSVSVPQEAGWKVPEGKNPWKSSKPFTRAELDQFVAAGIARRKLLDFEPVSYSGNLVPARPLGLAEVTPGTFGNYSRGVRNWLLWVERKPATISVKVRAGLIYNSRGDARIALYPAAEVEGKAVDGAAVKPDKQEHTVKLKTGFGGLHRLEVSDRTAGTAITWPDNLPLTLRSSPDEPATMPGRWSLYFYVPKGTRVVGGYSSGPGFLVDPSGKRVHAFEKAPGYFRVPVGEGQDGKLWKFDRCVGQRLLMTVPPYLARSGKELLLPAEVVTRDRGQ